MLIFAYIFIALTFIIAIFQIALALGAPLGEYTLGGKFPGKLPGQMRAAALVQILILFVFAFLVVVRAGIAFEQYYPIARIGIWFVVAFFVLGSILNLSSASRKEKLVMGPANVLALVSTFMVAIS
jgi:hypothetical protein